MLFHFVVVFVGCPTLHCICIRLMSFRPYGAGLFALPFQGCSLIKPDWPKQALGLQRLVSFGVVDIHPGGQVLLAAESLEVVAHRGDDADFKVVLPFKEVWGDVVDTSTKILYTSRLPVYEDLRNAFNEASIQDGRDGVHTVSTRINRFLINDGAAEMLVRLAVFQVEQGVKMGACGVVQEAVAQCHSPIV